MAIYPSFELQITIDGGSIQCIEGVTIAESLLVQDSIGADTSWKSYKGNLQDFTVGINGVDRGGYAVLLALKRGKTVFDWEIRTSDNEIITTGSGRVDALERGHDPELTEQSWNAQITGFNALTTV